MFYKKIWPAHYFLTALSCFFLIGFSHYFYEQGGLIRGQQSYAQQIYGGDYFVVLHPGVYWMASFLAHIGSWPVEDSLSWLLSIHVALLLCALIWALKLLDSNKADPYAYLLGAFAVMIAAPIGIPLVSPYVYNFTSYNRSAFLLRNGTHTAMLPYAMAVFGLLGYVLCTLKNTGVFLRRYALLAAILLCMSSLIKPSFAVSIIPATIIYMLFGRFSWKERGQVLYMVIPTIFLILCQFYIGFIHNPFAPRTIHLTISPWTVWTENNIHPVLSLLLAVAFPLFVLIYRGRKFYAPAIIAWMALAIAIIPYIFLMQVPGISSMADRDFEWSYLDARQILFLCSVAEWWKWMREEASEHAAGLPVRVRPVQLAGLLLILHAMFGYMRLVLIDMPK